MQSPEADTSAPPPPPTVVHFYKTCLGGPLIDTEHLPASVLAASPAEVAKKLIGELLLSSSKPETILARLGTLAGEETVISYRENAFTIKLPTLQKASDLDNLFSVLATSLGCCQRLFSKISTLGMVAV